MSDVVATAEAAATEVEADAEGKEAIYIKLGDFVKEKTGKRIGKTGGRELFDMVMNEFFALATKAGTARLNGGFGSFHVRHYTSGSRRLPSGQEVSFGERQKLRYEEGIVVKELVANGGDLEAAIKVRGTRKTEAEAPAATASKVKPASATEGTVNLD